MLRDQAKKKKGRYLGEKGTHEVFFSFSPSSLLFIILFKKNKKKASVKLKCNGVQSKCNTVNSNKNKKKGKKKLKTASS